MSTTQRAGGIVGHATTHDDSDDGGSDGGGVRRRRRRRRDGGCRGSDDAGRDLYDCRTHDHDGNRDYDHGGRHDHDDFEHDHHDAGGTAPGRDRRDRRGLNVRCRETRRRTPEMSNPAECSIVSAGAPAAASPAVAAHLANDWWPSARGMRNSGRSAVVRTSRRAVSGRGRLERRPIRRGCERRPAR